MNLKETGTIMDILKAAYPYFYSNQSEGEVINAIKLWAVMFADDNLDIVIAAVKSFIATDIKGYPPAIGVIKNKIADIRTSGELNSNLTEYEAWNLVKKAIGRAYNGYDITNKCYPNQVEFDKLPPSVRKIVGSPHQLSEWGMMSSEVLDSVVASNFMRSYKVRASNDREYALLPGDVKNFIASLAGKMSLPPG